MTGQGFEVETKDLDLLGQVFSRQQAHMGTIQGYVSAQCSASGAFTGVMSLLQGRYTPAHQTAVTGFGQGGDIAEACHTKIVATRTDLIATDRRQYEAMRALHPDLPPYQAPAGGGTLPAPGQTVPASTDDEGALKKFLELGERGKRPLDSVAALTQYDPTDPHGLAPGEPTQIDEYTDHSYWLHKGLDNVYQRGLAAYHDHQAGGLPGGLSGSDLQQQAALRTQLRYEAAHASGSSFVTDHTGLTAPPRDPHMPSTAFPSDDLRNGAHGAAENAGKIVNIVEAVPQFVDAGNRLGDSVDLDNQISAAADGPSNTSDRDWSQTQGSGW